MNISASNYYAVFYLILLSTILFSTLFFKFQVKYFHYIHFIQSSFALCHPHVHQFLYSPLHFPSYSFFMGSIPFYNFSLSGILWVINSLNLWVFLKLSLFFLHLDQDGSWGWELFFLSILKTCSIILWVKYCHWEVCCPSNYCLSTQNHLLCFIFDFCIQQFHYDMFSYRFFNLFYLHSMPF